MKAKVTKEFPGLRDGEIKVSQIKVGEVISGSLAEVAVREKWADEVKDEVGVVDQKPTDLNDLKVEELKELALKRGVDLGDATKKADIIAAIELAAEPK